MSRTDIEKGAEAIGLTLAYIASLEAEVERLRKFRSDVIALCAQEGNDGYPWDELQKLAEGEE